MRISLLLAPLGVTIKRKEGRACKESIGLGAGVSGGVHVIIDVTYTMHKFVRQQGNSCDVCGDVVLSDVEWCWSGVIGD